MAPIIQGSQTPKKLTGNTPLTGKTGISASAGGTSSLALAKMLSQGSSQQTTVSYTASSTSPKSFAQNGGICPGTSGGEHNHGWGQPNTITITTTNKPNGGCCNKPSVPQGPIGGCGGGKPIGGGNIGGFRPGFGANNMNIGNMLCGGGQMSDYAKLSMSGALLEAELNGASNAFSLMANAGTGYYNNGLGSYNNLGGYGNIGGLYGSVGPETDRAIADAIKKQNSFGGRLMNMLLTPSTLSTAASLVGAGLSALGSWLWGKSTSNSTSANSDKITGSQYSGSKEISDYNDSIDARDSAKAKMDQAQSELDEANNEVKETKTAYDNATTAYEKAKAAYNKNKTPANKQAMDNAEAAQKQAKGKYDAAVKKQKEKETALTQAKEQYEAAEQKANQLKTAAMKAKEDIDKKNKK